MRLQVRLTFGPTSGQVNIRSDIPPRQRYLMAECDTTSDQVHIWSDLKVRVTFGQMCPLQVRLWFRLTFSKTLGQPDLSSDVPPAETSCGQVWYYFGSSWHLVRSLGQGDLSQKYPPGWGFGSGWHLLRLQVRLTFGQMVHFLFVIINIVPRKKYLGVVIHQIDGGRI